MNKDENGYVNIRKVHDYILPGQVTVLASRPGMGKTALACDLIAVSDSNVGCMSGYFAVYEDAEEVVNRIAARGNVACMVFSSLDAFSLYDISVLQPPLFCGRLYSV